MTGEAQAPAASPTASPGAAAARTRDADDDAAAEGETLPSPVATASSPVALLSARSGAGQWTIGRLESLGDSGGPVQLAGSPRASAGGRLVAMPVQQGGKYAMWANGRLGPVYDRLDFAAIVATDAPVMAYVAVEGKTFRVVHGGEVLRAESRLRHPSLSADGKKVAWIAPRARDEVVVVHTLGGGTVDGPIYPRIDGRPVFGPKGELSYVVQERDHALRVHGNTDREWEAVLGPTFLGDGTLIYVGKNEQGWWLSRNGVLRDMLFTPRFAPVVGDDGYSLLWVASGEGEAAGLSRVVIRAADDSWEGPQHRHVGPVVFKDIKNFVYVAPSEDAANAPMALWPRRAQEPTFKRAVTVALSDSGAHRAAVVHMQTRGPATVLLDRRVVHSAEEIFALSFDGEGFLQFAARQGTQIRWIRLAVGARPRR